LLRALIHSPLAFAQTSELMIKLFVPNEHAPSFIFEAFAAVIVPVLLKAGESCPILSYLYLFHY